MYAAAAANMCDVREEDIVRHAQALYSKFLLSVPQLNRKSINQSETSEKV